MAAYYDEKTKTWFCKYRYKDWRGVSMPPTTKRGFKTKKEALKYEAAAKEKAQVSPNIALNTLAANFLEDYKINRRAASYRLTEHNLRLHILPILGEMPVDKITPIIVRKWQNDLAQKGKSESTIRSINATFKTVLNFAVTYYGLSSNPFSIVKPTGKTGRNTLFLEKSEWDRLALLLNDKYDNAVFSTLFWSGMRIGELMALKLEDLDFENDTINIYKQWDADDKVVGPPKTPNAVRKISIPHFVAQIIKSFFEAFDEVPEFPFQLITEKSINARLKKYCEKAGVTAITAHDLRHSHASYLMRTVPPHLVSKRLGHASVSITLNTYSHVYDKDDADLNLFLEKQEIAKDSSETFVGQM